MKYLCSLAKKKIEKVRTEKSIEIGNEAKTKRNCL